MALELIKSNRTIEVFKPGAGRLSDGGGLYLLPYLNGGSHCWRFDFTFEGKRKTLSLQSSFEQTFPPDTIQLDAGSTLSDLAAANRVVVVGACNRANHEEAGYSAHGGPTDGDRQVDVLAEADQSPTTFGLIATGAASGTEVRMSGTSVAAPMAARALLNVAAKAVVLPSSKTAVQTTTTSIPPQTPKSKLMASLAAGAAATASGAGAARPYRTVPNVPRL